MRSRASRPGQRAASVPRHHFPIDQQHRYPDLAFPARPTCACVKRYGSVDSSTASSPGPPVRLRPREASDSARRRRPASSPARCQPSSASMAGDVRVAAIPSSTGLARCSTAHVRAGAGMRCEIGAARRAYSRLRTAAHQRAAASAAPKIPPSRRANAPDCRCGAFGCVTITCGTNSASSFRRSAWSFSSMLTTTWVGSQLADLVYVHVLGAAHLRNRCATTSCSRMDAETGAPDQPGQPGRASHSSSVIDGTRHTMRASGAGACAAVPTASIR